MRTDTRQTISRETWDEQRSAGRYNPASVAVWRSKCGTHRWTLAAGDSDDIHFFREPGCVLCLTINHRYGYIGLELFSENANEPDNPGIFSQNPDEEFPGIMELMPINAAKRLANHIDH